MPHHRPTTRLARSLRRSMTAAERALWARLRRRRLGARFRRQHPVGPYVVDFFCFEAKLVVEVDGGQHESSEKDRARDRWLVENGYNVLRFWNNEVLRNTEAVLEVIRQELGRPSLLFPSRREGRRCG